MKLRRYCIQALR